MIATRLPFDVQLKYWAACLLDDLPVDPAFPRDEFERRVETLVEQVDRRARVDELKRVQLTTLDADEDVWSLTDDQELIPLTQRLASLV